MIGTHKTNDGQTMLIAEMDNVHLVNTVKQLLRSIRETEKMATLKVDDYQRALYGIKKTTPEYAAELNRERFHRLTNYLAECYLRGLDDGLVDDVRATVRRSEAMRVSALEQILDFLPESIPMGGENSGN